MKEEQVRLQYQLSILYENMRLKKLSKAEWLLQSRDLLLGLMSMDQENQIIKLNYVQFLITIKDIEKAKEILASVSEYLSETDEKDPICRGYYIYLTSLVSDEREYVVWVSEQLQIYSQKYSMVWQLQWLLYHVKISISEESANSTLVQYLSLKEMFLKGCRSPFLYLEAKTLLERNHTLIYQFSEFEVQVLLYMFRNDMISDTLVKIVSDYMLQVKFYRNSYVLLLKYCYKNIASKELLEAICTMLIQGNISDTSSLSWYYKGILLDIHVGGIYEAYMKALPMVTFEDAIPIQVLQYFLHATILEQDKRAYLYAYVHKNKIKYFDLYKEYEPLILPFVMDSLCKGQMNHGLAYLYSKILTQELVTEQYYETFMEICHSCYISGLEPKSGRLLIQYTHMQEEVSIAYENGSLIAPIFGMEYQLTTEDNRGIKNISVKAHVEDLMPEDFFAKVLGELSYHHVMYQVERVENMDFDAFVQDDLEQVFYILSLEQVTKRFKQELVAQIVPYLDVWGAYDKIHHVLDVCMLDQDSLMEFEKDTWKEAYLKERIGIYGIKFLLDYDDGDLLEQCGIFRLAKEYGLDVVQHAGVLLRKMLEQEQVVAQYQDIFITYVEGNGDYELIQAFIENRAAVGYTKELKISSEILDAAITLSREGIRFSLITKLWLLKEIAKNGVEQATQGEREVCINLLNELCQQDIYFTWMKSFGAWCPKLRRKEAIQVLEYIADRKEPIWVQYTISQGTSTEESITQSEVMTQIEDFIYVKEFLLFYTERVHYEIYTLQGMQKVLLQQGVLHNSTLEYINDKSRFARINEIQELREKRQLDDASKYISEYYKLDDMVGTFFHIK